MDDRDHTTLLGGIFSGTSHGRGAELEASGAACGGVELVRALQIDLAESASVRIQLSAAVAQDDAGGIA
jgi:hypothetical protein